MIKVRRKRIPSVIGHYKRDMNMRGRLFIRFGEVTGGKRNAARVILQMGAYRCPEALKPPFATGRSGSEADLQTETLPTHLEK
jgi:hypothetical protein